MIKLILASMLAISSSAYADEVTVNMGMVQDHDSTGNVVAFVQHGGSDERNITLMALDSHAINRVSMHLSPDDMQKVINLLLKAKAEAEKGQ